jgi:hypothetical protein
MSSNLYLSEIAIYLQITDIVFFAAPGISASYRSSDSTTPLLSREDIRSLFFHKQYFVKNEGSVMKPMRHSFWTDISHMCHICEM